ncbi:MAG: ABC transporter ATP-binding protein [Steroidobacteraceae bacterium]
MRAVTDLSFTARGGEVLTLLGPSGCGKTTSLRAIAGLETPRHGRITIDARTVFDAQRRINLPPERRGLSMIFQSYAIWPHLTVFENVAFGLRARHVARDQVVSAVRRSLDLVGLGTLAERSATRLSGGQQQRVALARSIAANSGVILFDEPLSNLDAQLRLEMRLELRKLQRNLGLTAIYVTHDQEEALVLSDRVAVMRDGAIEQMAPPAEIHGRPRTRFVAEFVGVRNILPCDVVRLGGRSVAMLPGRIALTVDEPAPEGRVFVCFRPISVRLSLMAEPQSFPGIVTSMSFLGDLAQYEVSAGELTIEARGLPRGDLAEGARVFWSVPAEACFFVTEPQGR